MELKEIEKKLPWGIIGVVLTLVFGGIGIYTYLNQLKPSLAFEIVRESNVFDVYKQVDDLEITFKNNDIRKGNLNLRTYRIKVLNNGSIDILSSQFDPNIEWGIRLNKGSFLNDVNLITSNSKYLEHNLKFNNNKDNKIIFNKLIIEQDKFFIFEVLVLHNKDDIPVLAPIGKIAGIEELKIINVAELMNEEGFFLKLFDGNIFVHLIRFLIYFILLTFVIAIISIPLDKLSRKNRKKRLEKIKKEIQEIFGEEFDIIDFDIFEDFHFINDDIIKEIVNEINILKNSEHKKQVYKNYLELYIEHRNQKETISNLKKDEKLSYHKIMSLEFLFNSKLLNIKKNKLKINKTLVMNIDLIIKKLNFINNDK